MAHMATKGTGVFLGIGEDFRSIERKLHEASEIGINSIFTSLQLSSADFNVIKEQFPKLVKVAHNLGMKIDADFGAKTAEYCGINIKSPEEIKNYGVDIARLDYGFTPEETAEMSKNNCRLIIELNASCKPTIMEALLGKLDKSDVNKDNVRTCHNYYPKRYTGLEYNDVLVNNSLIHKYGYRVAGFISSNAHQRAHNGDGLPTLEEFRSLPVNEKIQGMLMLGMDDIYFGDDFPSVEEMKCLCQTDFSCVTLRYRANGESAESDYIDGKILGHKYQTGLADIERLEPYYEGPYTAKPVRSRRIGDITVDNAEYCRYAGEINIMRRELPAETKQNIIGTVIDEDIPLLARPILRKIKLTRIY